MASPLNTEIQDEELSYEDALSNLSTAEAEEFISSLDTNPDEKKEIIKEIKRPKTLCVMACGLTGAGKSTLLNALSGKTIFEVGHILPTTLKVDRHQLDIDNSTLILCDTPGFKDGLGNEDNYLKEIRTKCADVDTLFYCISLHPVRITLDDDVATLKKLHKALDREVWNHCVIVLTFANDLIGRVEENAEETVNNIIKTKTAPTPEKCKKLVQKHLKDQYSSDIVLWKEQVQKAFRRAGINPDSMPIVEAGKAKKPMLFPTDKKPWLTTFWETVRDASHDDGSAVLFRVNMDRIASSFSVRQDLPLEKQKIIISKSVLLENLAKKFPSIAAALGVGGAASVTGAGIGATIGALAIGIPSFGVAAGVGLLLGGLIGGGLGVSFVAATVSAAKKIKMKATEGQ